MFSHKTKGIILKYGDLKGADRLLTVFTYDFGKISAVVRGAKKHTSKLMGCLDVFNYSDIMLIQGKSFDVVAGNDSIYSFPNIRSNVKLTALAYCLMEICDKFLADCQKEEKVFLLLLCFLKIIETDCFSAYKIYHSFLLRMINLSGFGIGTEKYSQPINDILEILQAGSIENIKKASFNRELEKQISVIEDEICSSCEILKIKSKTFLDFVFKM